MSLFADTSFYVGLANPRDELHDLASSVAREHADDIVTTEYVLVELANRLCGSRQKRLFLEFLGDLRNDPYTIVLPADGELLESGLRLYASRLDKDWSLTDCISMVVMRERGISDVLTADHHFDQAGFTVLLK